MKMLTLITLKNAVTTSNMVTFPDPAIAPSARRRRTVKRIHRQFGFSNRADDFEQQTKQPLIHHDQALPISAAFALRYVHDLMRKWAASGGVTRPLPAVVGAGPVEWYLGRMGIRRSDQTVLMARSAAAVA